MKSLQTYKGNVCPERLRTFHFVLNSHPRARRVADNSNYDACSK